MTANDTGAGASQERSVKGQRIRELREARGLTLTAMAASCTINTGYLSLIERELRRPSFAVMIRIAAVLGVPASDLLTPPSPRSSDYDVLVETLTGAGLDPAVALRIQRNTSPRVQRAILRAITTTTDDGRAEPRSTSGMVPGQTEQD